MSITLVTAPPAGGKTHYCINRAAAARAKDPFAPVRVFVPDALALAYWKRALASASKEGAFIGVGISAFAKFCAELLFTSSAAPELIPPRLDRLCVKTALENAAPELRYFNSIAEKPGLVSELEKTFRELRQESVSPEQLDGMEPRRADTARIYAEYLRILHTHQWTGGSGLASAAAEVIRSEKCLGTPLVIVDGFDYFTKSRLDLIRALDAHGCEVLITLPKLTDEIREALRFRLIELPPVKRPAPKALMLETSSRTEEAYEVLRELKRRIVHEGIKPGNCAVFVPDMEVYRPLLLRAGSEMGIPLRFAGGDCMTDVPAAEALLRLLRLQLNDYPSRELIAVLRSPYFSGCPDPETDSADTEYLREVSDLEKFGRDQLVISGEDEWRNASQALAHMGDFRLNRIVRSLYSLMDILRPLSGSHSRGAWSSWLKSVIEKIGFYSRLASDSANPESIIRETFEKVLNRLTVCEKKLGLRPVTYNEFVNEFENELRCLTLSERMTNSFGAVFVGDVFRAGGARWNLVALMGLAESSFPRQQNEDLILTKKLRREIGLPEEKPQTELMAHAVARADGMLILSRPRKTDAGEEWPASIYWTKITDYLPEKPEIKTIGPGIYPPAASVSELTFDLIRTNSSMPGKLLEKDQAAVQRKIDEAFRASELLERQNAGAYFPESEKSASPDFSVFDQPYNCTSVELYQSCPFRWYLEKCLGIAEQKEVSEGMDAVNRGILYHEILQRAFPEGADLGDKDAALARADAAMDQLLEDAPAHYGFRESVLWKNCETVHIRRRIHDTIAAMYEKKFGMNGLRCAGTEVEFGKGSVPSLNVETENGILRLKGRIDRIDVNASGTIRVVDYKLSNKDITKDAINEGRHIQAAVYAEAAEHCLGKGRNGGGWYWAVNSGSAVDGSECDWQKSVREFAYGISEGVFPAGTAKNCPNYCPGLNWCKAANPEEYNG